MKQEISNHLVTGLAATAGASGIATGIMGFFGHYAAGIGAIFTILTFFTWFFFQLRSDKKLSQADENKRQIQLVKAKQATDMDTVTGILRSIESKMIKSNQDKQG